MSQRIALRCPSCQKLSYRPVGFVMARSHFVCKYCHELGKIDRRELILAQTRHRVIVEVEADALDPETAAKKHGHASMR